jgi:predicted nucleotide-binding protein (sugar kinase/HSP70/actin superfamily)
MKILRRLGYDVDFIVIDDPSDIGGEELLKRFGRIASESKKSKAGKIKAGLDAVKIMNFIDHIEAKARDLAGYELNKGECKRLLNSCKRDAVQCSDPKDVIKVLKDYRNKLSNVEVDINKKPLKIAVIGEIYTIIEPYSNLYIEDKLMGLGVSTYRKLTPSWWVRSTILKPFGLNDIDIRRTSKKYIPLCIGGHAQECIGEAVLAKEQNYDGVIQVLPMGCMPEIVSKAILPSVSKELDIPVMTLVVDEMTGEAGYVTRLEAFVDLLERRRYNVQSGS